MLQTEDLLNDPRVSSMLASGFPLRLHYRVQIWRSRTFVDAQTYQTEWDVVVRHEPLLDQYQVAEVYRQTQRSTRYAGREELARYLETRRLIKIGPTDPGEYYYVAAIEISTLSDTDIKTIVTSAIAGISSFSRLTRPGCDRGRADRGGAVERDPARPALGGGAAEGAGRREEREVHCAVSGER